MPRAFKKGYDARRRTSGGAQPGAGRPPDWLKAKCDKIIDKYDLLGFLGKVAGGESIEQVVTDQGETIRVPAPVKDRLRAAEMLLDRRFGKPTQQVEASGNIGIDIVSFINQAEHERGL